MTSATRMNQAHNNIHTFDQTKLSSTQVSRQSTLSKEPNPFEQSFGNSSLVKKESPKLNIKPNLPSINQINQAQIPINEGPIKLSPMILDPKHYNSNEFLPMQNPRLVNVLHPPIKETFASRLPEFNQVQTNLVPRAVVQVNQFNHPLSLAINTNPNINPVFPAPAQFPVNVNISANQMALNQQMLNNSIPIPLVSQIQANTSNVNVNVIPAKKPAGGRKRLPTKGMSEKKIDFLARNRKAALKCRERKKNEIRNLEEDTKYIQYTNTLMENEIRILSEEATRLRALIINHASCPIARTAGILGEQTLPISLVKKFP